jgi:2-C-methyl-D-erythritol 4-phosphate cytidylyltransferase
VTAAPAQLEPVAGTRRCAVVVLAAGSGSQVGSVRSKIFLPLLGRSVIDWSLRILAGLDGVDRCLLVIRPSDADIVEELRHREGWDPRVEVVFGGDTRHQSERNALEHLAGAIVAGSIDVVMVHDGARPCITAALASEVVATACDAGGAFPGVELESCLESTSQGQIEGGTLVRTQTPQAFRARPLLDAYRAAALDGFVGTDTAMCVERYSDLPVRYVPSDSGNVKITYPQDLFVAQRLLRRRGATER